MNRHQIFILRWKTKTLKIINICLNDDITFLRERYELINFITMKHCKLLIYSLCIMYTIEYYFQKEQCRYMGIYFMLPEAVVRKCCILEKAAGRRNFSNSVVASSKNIFIYLVVQSES